MIVSAVDRQVLFEDLHFPKPKKQGTICTTSAEGAPICNYVIYFSSEDSAIVSSAVDHQASFEDLHFTNTWEPGDKYAEHQRRITPTCNLHHFVL